MKRTRFWLVVVVLITFAAMAAPAEEVHINATAVTESGSQLAKGTCRVVTTKEELKRLYESLIPEEKGMKHLMIMN